MLPLAVRKLSCNPALRRVGHRLHVNHFVRRLYCRLLSGERHVARLLPGCECSLQNQ